MSDSEPVPRNTWANFIRSARQSRGWSIEELAKRADVSRMTIIRWEGGATRFRPDTIQRVAAVLEVPQSDAMRAAFGDGPQGELPPPLPREISRLIDAYTAITDPAERAEFLQRVAWVTEWATLRHRVRDTGPTKD